MSGIRLPPRASQKPFVLVSVLDNEWSFPAIGIHCLFGLRKKCAAALIYVVRLITLIFDTSAELNLIRFIITVECRFVGGLRSLGNVIQGCALSHSTP